MTDTPENRIRVLEVVGICGGGLGRHVRGLSEGLVEQGHQVTVAYTPHSVDQAFQRFVDDRRHEIRFVPLEIQREISPASDLRAIVRLMRLIRREGPFDVVHGHSAKGGAIARIAGRLFGVPTVYTPNSLIMSSPAVSRTEAAVYTLIERLFGHLATSRLITVSDAEREFILKLKLVPRERLVLVENGIEDENFVGFSPKTVDKPLDERPLTFGSLIRFSSQKAPENLVEAFVRLNAALPQVPMRLVIAGDGELFAEVEEQVEASGLGEKISLLGWRADTKELLREFDVFVLSSLFEGGPYVLMEAMAAQLPIVSTEVFGTRETVARVPGNVLVPVGDTGALAQGMQKIATADDPGSLRRSLQKLGQANHDYAREHFEQCKTTRRTLEVYRGLC